MKTTKLLLAVSFCVLFSSVAHAVPYSRVIVGSGISRDFSSGTFANLSLTSGNNDNSGGAIHNFGYVSGTDLLFTANTTDYRGGAIFNTGTMVLVSSTFSGNKALSNWGGALVNDGFDVRTAIFSGTGLVFISNTARAGGAIANRSTTFTLTSGTFLNNVATSGGGGAVYIDNAGSASSFLGTNLAFVSNTAAGSSSGNGNGGAIYNRKYSMVLVSSTFIGNRSVVANGGAIRATEGGVITGTNLVFISNTAVSGGAYYGAGGSGIDTFVSSTFKDNTATTSSGGAIYAGTQFVGEDLVFTNNRANGTGSGASGGALYFGSNSNILTSITFTGNYAGYYGGAIYNGGNLSASGLLFTSNTAVNFGGAIYMRNAYGSVAVSLSTFEGNYAAYGGAISNYTGLFTGSNLIFTSNTASLYGGALFNYTYGGFPASAIVTSATFSKNYSGNLGGAVVNAGTFTGSNLLFVSNSSGYVGGALYSEAATGTVTLSSGTFSNNYAAVAGGAIYNEDNSVISGTNLVFTSNTASDAGGAIFNVSSGVIDIVSGTFENNYSGTVGGAIYSAEDAPLTLDVSAMSMVGNQTSGTGGAIYSGTNFLLAVVDGGVFTATTNKALDDDSGGFLYIASGSMAFDIGAGATATIGGANSIANSTDSISAADDTISLTKTGDGALTLWANNTYTGTTFINAGLLNVHGRISSTHAIVANSSTLAGTGTAGGDVTIQGGGHLSPGASPGQFTILGDLTFGNNAQFDVELGAITNPDPGHIYHSGTNDRVIVEGDVILSGTSYVNVAFSAPVEKGEYDLINYKGGLLPDATGTMTLGTVIDNSGTLVADTSPYSVVTSETNWIKLMYDMSGSGYTYWDGGDSGNWADNAVTGGSGTWFAPGINTGYTAWTDSGGFPNGEWLDAAFAIFKAASGTVTVENSGAAININGMQFMVDGYLLTGGTLTTSGTDANIQVRVDPTYSATVATEITGTHGLEKTGGGTLILSGSNTYEGDTLLNNGRLVIDGYIGGAATVLTATNATMLSGSGVIGGAVTMLGGSTLSPDGKLTIGNNLTLKPDSTLAFDLASAEIWGGGNDWLDVGGDLTIEASSTLAIASVTTPGAGLYHLVSYTGALSYDNLALDYGTTGLSSDNTYIQIAVANEVNLVTTGTDDGHTDPTRGTEFIHWDAGVLNDGTVAGGFGTWQAWKVSGSNTALAPENWATADGSANAMWQTDGHAIFGGDAPGTVTLSNAQGDITAVGLTFNVDGYLLQGDTLRLTSTNSILNATLGVSATLAMSSTATGNVTKTGEGAIHLDSANTHTGTTTIAAGELRVNAALDSAAVVADAGLLGGSGTINAPVVINTATLSPTGTLNINGDLTLAAGSVSAFDLGAGGNDLANITGALTLGGTLNVAANGAFGTGEYRLFNYTGALTDNTMAIGAMPVADNGENYFIQTGKDHEVNLVYIHADDTGTVNYWDGARANYTAIEGGSGTWQAWSSGRDNWTTQSGSTLNAPWQSYTHAMFTTTGGTVQVDATHGDVTLKGATFTVSDYRIQGDRLFLGGTTSALLDTQTGTTTIASVLTGSASVGITKSGAGTLILTASNTYTGTTGVDAGTLRLADLGATGTGNVTVAAAATLDLAGTGAYANNIGGSGTALVSGNGINITGTNTIAAWDIQGSGTISEQQNLGAGATNIDGVLVARAASPWVWTNALTGSGLLKIATDSSTLDFATSAGTTFTGTVGLRNTTLSLSSSNNAALLANATLQVSTGGTLFADNTTQQTLGGLDMAAGGAVAIEMNGVVPTTVLQTGTLAVDNTATIIFANYTGTTPVISTTNPKKFLDQDAPSENATLLIATDNLLTNPRQVAIHNADGDPIGPTQDIEYDEVIATYGYAGVVSGSAYTATSATAGLYYDYVLTQLDVKTGTTLVLDTTGATDTTLAAGISGSGGVTFTATNGSITLAGDNSYSGTTTITTGTVIADADHVLGNTDYLVINTGGALDLLNNTQSIVNGAQIDGGLFGSGSLGLGGLATITSTNATFSANVGVGGTTVLSSPESLGKEGVITIADTALLQLDTATGTLAKTISGTGNVELLDSVIEVTGANGAFSGTFLIGDGSKLAASTDANLGDANLSGEGVFEKLTGATTITIDHANAEFTGTTLITGGTLVLGHLGGVGSSEVVNDAVLDLATVGTFANNISGTGTTAVTGAGVNITGTNTGIAWNITGSGTVGATHNLGDGATNIEGLLVARAASPWDWTNALTGSGTLRIDVTTLAFADTTGTAFLGTVELRTAAFDLSGDNTLALTKATLQIDTDAHVTVGDGVQNIGNLTLTSGTLGFTLAGSGTGVLGTIKTNVLDVQNTVIVVDTSLGSSLPLLQQDETQSIRLIESTTLAAGSGTMLNIHDETGNLISDASVGDIIQGAEIVAEGTYDYKALATNNGLTLDYMLEALKLYDGKTTTLTGDIADAILAGADELHAIVSGDGSLRIEADDTIYLNAANSYTGTTTVTAGTLVAGVDGALGATAQLYVTATATFDLNNTAQTIREGGAINGTITGSGALTLSGGTMTIANANTGYTAQTNINAPATVVIEDAAGLGASNVALAGVLEVSNAASGTLTATLAGTGTLVKSDAGVLTVANANALTGLVDIKTGRLSATRNDALGTASIDVEAGAVFEQTGFAGTLQNNLSGAGTHTLAAAHITLDDPAKYRVANTTLDGASMLTLAANNITIGALSLNSGTLAFATAVPTATGTIGSLTGAAGAIVMNANMGLLTSSDTIYNGGAVANHLVIGSAGSLAQTVHINAANDLDARNVAIALIDVDAASTARFVLDIGKLEYDMTALELVRGDGSVYTPGTNTWYLSDRSLSHAADAIIQTAATLALDWAYSLDALYLRMGEVRAENLNNSNLSGNLWVRARGYRMNANSELTGYGLEQYGWGATAGADKVFDAENGVNLLGAFIDMGSVDRKFDNSGNGKTHSVGIGAYGTILKNDGWFIDAIARLDRYSNTFEAKSYDGKTTRGRYTTRGMSLSLEAGRRFQRADGWWIEPGFQAAVLWLNGASYATDATGTQRAIKVKVNDSDTWQYRALVRFGRQFRASRWYPYGKVAGVSIDGNGGAINAHGKRFDADYDGKRVEFGAGTMYRINDISQVYFDYEYAKAGAYERPWSINAGYRRLW